MRILLSALALLAASVGAFAADYVRGYTRNDGTYVQPHYRTSPDGNAFNNYSTQGNYNPYTGKSGTVDPYAPSNSNTLRGLGGGNDMLGRMR
jgi:hypothetical protein